MTFATMDVLLNMGDYTKIYQSCGRKYPDPDYGGYGGMAEAFFTEHDGYAASR
jgi:hypothetical protein